MKKVKSFSIEEVLSQMKVTFSNAQTPEILGVLQSVGYTEERLNGYLDKVAEIEKLTQNQQKEYGEQYAKTNEFEQKRAEIDKIYKKDLTLARIFFKNDVQATATLELNGRRKSAYSSWHKQVSNFYAQLLANSEFLTKMQAVGVTEEKINDIQTQLNMLETLKKEQKKEMGEAQKATEERDHAFDALYPHYSELIEFSKALLENEQLLESLGIVVKR